MDDRGKCFLHTPVNGTVQWTQLSVSNVLGMDVHVKAQVYWYLFNGFIGNMLKKLQCTQESKDVSTCSQPVSHMACKSSFVLRCARGNETVCTTADISNEIV